MTTAALPGSRHENHNTFHPPRARSDSSVGTRKGPQPLWLRPVMRGGTIIAARYSTRTTFRVTVSAPAVTFTKYTPADFP